MYCIKRNDLAQKINHSKTWEGKCWPKNQNPCSEIHPYPENHRPLRREEPGEKWRQRRTPRDAYPQLTENNECDSREVTISRLSVWLGSRYIRIIIAWANIERACFKQTLNMCSITSEILWRPWWHLQLKFRDEGKRHDHTRFTNESGQLKNEDFGPNSWLWGLRKFAKLLWKQEKYLRVSAKEWTSKFQETIDPSGNLHQDRALLDPPKIQFWDLKQFEPR